MTVRQFDVCPNPDPDTTVEHPYLIVLQSDRLPEIGTRIVAPLVSPRSIKFFENLLPRVQVEGRDYVLATPDMGAIPVSSLKPAVANLEEQRYRIVGALDQLFLGI